MFGMYHKTLYICTRYAEIAQLVEHNLAKVRVASSSLVFRSFLKGCSNGGIGRHEGLKIPWPVMAVRVQVPLRVRRKANRCSGGLSFLFFLIQSIQNQVGRHDRLWNTSLFIPFPPPTVPILLRQDARKKFFLTEAYQTMVPGQDKNCHREKEKGICPASPGKRAASRIAFSKTTLL